jgi:putative transposase
MPIDAAKKNRYRVRRGEPGRNIITLFKDGGPVVENPPVALAAAPSSLSIPSPIIGQIQPELPGLSSPSTLPAVVTEGREAIILSPYQKKADLRASLILAFREEASKRSGLKREILEQFLRRFNSGTILPEIREKLCQKKGSPREYWPITSPTFYRWMKAFDDQGTDGLVLRYGGAGISKITDHEKNFLLTLILHQNRLKVGYAIELLKDWFKRRKLESPSSPATLRRFIEQFKKEHYDLWVFYREGEKALNDKVLPYAERDWRVLDVGEGLVADGHRLNFQVVHPITGKPVRPALVLFWDWKSSYPLGWEIMFEENIQCVASALRNAILALGKTPKWVLLDNGKAFKAKIFTEGISFEDSELPGMFARLNINCHFAQPYNAQAKPIERIFGIINEQLERLVESYTGSSINDKPAWTKRNEKFARSLHDSDNIPTVQEADQYVRAWRDCYAERPSRGRDGLRPIDIFMQGKGAGVNPAGLIYLMMDREIKTINRNGITWLGWHWFHEALYGLKDRVIIRYSLSDLSQIYVFYKNEFLCVARPVEPVHPMASESGTPKDMEDVKRQIAKKRDLKKQTVKLYRLLDKKQEQLPWKEIIQEIPDVVETIEKIEAEKPKPKFISPFLEISDKELAPPNQTTTDGTDTEDESPLSCPRSLRSAWETYEWFIERDRNKLNIADLAWMDKFEDDSLYQSLYRLEPDPNYRSYLQSVESRWQEIKKNLVVDPGTGLIQPGNSKDSRIVSDHEVIRYGFYRAMKNRFPGTLNDASWDWIEKYQASDDWRFFFSYLRNPRMYRPSTSD